jgi:hypothetical protein
MIETFRAYLFEEDGFVTDALDIATDLVGDGSPMFICGTYTGTAESGVFCADHGGRYSVVNGYALGLREGIGL